MFIHYTAEERDKVEKELAERHKEALKEEEQ